MANGLGFAIGEGVEAGVGAFQSTLNYKLALAQQQLQAGAQAETRRLREERQAFEVEKFDFEKTAIERERKEAILERAEAKELRELTFPEPSGIDVTKSVAGGRASSIDKEVKRVRRERLTAKLFPETLKPTGGPKVKGFTAGQSLGYVDEQGNFVQTGKVPSGPTRDTSTQTERFMLKLLDPNTSTDERALIERQMFGNKTGIDGVSFVDISRILNDVYPESFGERPGLPENLKGDPVALYRHGAQLVKELQGEPSPDLGGGEITVDDFFN